MTESNQDNVTRRLLAIKEHTDKLPFFKFPNGSVMGVRNLCKFIEMSIQLKNGEQLDPRDEGLLNGLKPEFWNTEELYNLLIEKIKEAAKELEIEKD